MQINTLPVVGCGPELKTPPGREPDQGFPSGKRSSTAGGRSSQSSHLKRNRIGREASITTSMIGKEPSRSSHPFLAQYAGVSTSVSRAKFFAARASCTAAALRLVPLQIDDALQARLPE